MVIQHLLAVALIASWQHVYKYSSAGSASTMPAPEHLRVEGLLESAAVISEPLPRFSFIHGDLVSIKKRCRTGIS